MSPQWLLMLALVPAAWLPAATAQMGDTAAWDVWVYEQVESGTGLPPAASPPAVAPSPRSPTPPPLDDPDLEQLLHGHFPSTVVGEAVRVVWCESRNQPDAYNPTSGASGLFQHLARYWPGRSEAALGYVADVFDPVANVAVAAWLWAQTGTFSTHWYPSEHCWGGG